MGKVKLIPELRFPGFEGEWEEKKVGELCDFIVPGRNKPKVFNGNIPWITTPDIDQSGIVEISKKGLAITKAEADSAGAKIVPQDAIIMSCVGELGILAIAKNKLIINQQLHAFIPKEKINNRFLLHELATKKKFMEMVATKTAVPYMNKDNCNSIPIIFPEIEEQTRIATFLTSVDKRISLLTQKKEKLVCYKQGVMQKIFSQELRFKDEDGKDFPEWEEKRLGEIARIKTGKLDANAMVENGKYRFYTCAKDFYKIDNYAFDTEALLISGNGANVGYIHYYKGKFNAYQRTYVLDGFMENIIYVKYYLDIFLCNRINSEKKEGNTPYIVISTLSEMEIYLPSLSEQTRIAAFLTALDQQIEKVDAQIGEMKVWKKGLLQKMFV